MFFFINKGKELVCSLLQVIELKFTPSFFIFRDFSPIRNKPLELHLEAVLAEQTHLYYEQE